MEINTIYNENCLVTMAKMPSEFIDLTVTSPPYGDIRWYGGYDFDFKTIAEELYRVTKTGGVVVWVVGDQTVKGGESLESFRQALYFQEIGFTVHDTMIYQKSGFNFPANNRYHQVFEYMFVLSKGKPKTFNPIMDRKNKYVGQKAHGLHRGKNNESYTNRSLDKNLKAVEEYGKRFNVWYYVVGGGNVTKDKIAHKHPAIFPELLAQDHIISWSNEGDLIYDPFMGSGTTAKMALLNKRNFIGSEINQEYVNLANERLGYLNGQIKCI